MKRKKLCAENVSTCIWSFLVSVALMLGAHIKYVTIQETEKPQITPYSWFDVLFCIASTMILYLLVSFVRRKIQNDDRWQLHLSTEKTVSVRLVLIVASCLFLFWLPYLYIYYPGFIFNDSRSSIWQALGQMQLNNHFPVMYTLFIKLCLRIGAHFGSLVRGVALYSLLQMIFMAWGISYLISWLYIRFSLKKWMLVVLTGVFALSRYIAQYGIAMWKDPIFSIAVVLVTIWLFELLYKEDARRTIEAWKMIRLLCALLVMILSRNNGIYITFAILVVTLLGVLFYKNRKQMGKVLLVIVIAIVCAKVITGSVYESWGVMKDDEKTESYGIFLAQMARVVVCDGNLSEADKEYMNKIVPIEEYTSVYKADCIDSIKWSEHYNGGALEKDFFKTYFSILKKNPKICFEAWELQTFGFWTLNQPEILTFDGNILCGALRNVQPDGVGIEGIWTKPVDENAKLVKLFPYQSKCIPIGYAHWLLIGLALFALIRYNWKRLVVLSPALGLMATLIIASPIYYWPRYGLAQQLLLPLFIIMIFVKEGEPSNG